MIRMAVAGMGKMGLSHVAIVRAHPDVNLVAGCDQMTYLNDVLSTHMGLTCYTDFDDMLQKETLDAVLIATPTKAHASMVSKAFEHGIHVFCEKPFVLNIEDGERLVAEAEARQLVTQVGYHYRFVGAFQEAARIVQSGALGQLHHVRAEAYGPVVVRPKGGTWRSNKAEGGGALYDYACHAIDAVNFIVGTPTGVSGVVQQPVFSKNVDDEIYCTLHFDQGISGQLCVNWSDESFRKMSTKISVWGTNGRITVDRQECQIYLREPHPDLPGITKGWTVRYTTDLTNDVWYYLRGEEYSAQIDHFVRRVHDKKVEGVNTFKSALMADRVVSMIAAGGSKSDAPLRKTSAPNWFQRVFG